MPVIPATQEAEIGRITVQGQPRQNSEMLSEKQLKQKGDVGWLKK
jgi:hypothetical protein